MNSVANNMSVSRQCFLRDEEATIQAGNDLAQRLRGGMIVFLEGTLGVGKTTMTRGILGAFGHLGAIKSPTYTLVEVYKNLSLTIYHFDLYRLSSAKELEYIGIRDYLSEQSLCLVEWPEKGKSMLPSADVIIQLTSRIYENKVGRQLTMWVAAS